MLDGSLARVEVLQRVHCTMCKVGNLATGQYDACGLFISGLVQIRLVATHEHASIAQVACRYAQTSHARRPRRVSGESASSPHSLNLPLQYQHQISQTALYSTILGLPFAFLCETLANFQDQSFRTCVASSLVRQRHVRNAL